MYTQDYKKRISRLANIRICKLNMLIITNSLSNQSDKNEELKKEKELLEQVNSFPTDHKKVECHPESYSLYEKFDQVKKRFETTNVTEIYPQTVCEMYNDLVIGALLENQINTSLRQIKIGFAIERLLKDAIVNCKKNTQRMEEYKFTRYYVEYHLDKKIINKNKLVEDSGKTNYNLNRNINWMNNKLNEILGVHVGITWDIPSKQKTKTC